ncbi:ComEC/Rec2 family competence protein [bacterium]|nr:ComEC/Rec2 family competence protein [bacterium]
MKRPMVPMTLAFLLGLTLGHYEMAPPAVGLGLCIVFLAAAVALLTWTRARRPAFVAVLVSLVGLGALRWDGWEQSSRARAREARFFATLDAGRVEGTLLDCLSSRQRGTWRLADVRATVGRRTYTFSSHAMIRLATETARTYRPGDRLAIEGGLHPIEASGLPGQPDWPDYYAARNIAARVWQRRDRAAEVMGRDGSLRFRLQHWLFSTRATIAGALSRHLAPEHASLALAMLLGEMSGWTPEKTEALRTSGLYHLTSVSGLHVMGLVAGMLWAMRRLGLSRRAVAILALPVIVAFVLLVGARAPAVRAGLVAGVLLLGWLLDRDTDGLNLLALAALSNLLFVPYQMLEAGFQLSYLTVAGLIVCNPMLQKLHHPHRPWRNGLLSGLFTSSVATAVNTPLLLYHFGRASLLPVASNLLALPMVALIMPLGALFNLLSLLPLPDGVLLLLSWPLAALLWILSGIIAVTGAWSWAVWRSGAVAETTVACAVLLLLVLASPPRWPRLRRPRLVAGLAIVALAVWTGLFSDPARGVMRVRFLSLGQGDATLLSLPFGGTMLVDGGPGDPDGAPSRLLELLKHEGIRRLDLVVLTHPEEDHIGDLPEVLSTCSIGAFVSSGKSKPTRIFQRLDETIQARGIPHFTVERGDRIAGLPGVEIDVLSPAPETSLRPAQSRLGRLARGLSRHRVSSHG